MYKVLIAEDEADIRRLISFNLERESYDTLLAGDGEEAVLMAYKKIPDLIILDLMLPKMDGFSVFKELRLDSRTKDVPVIMLTAKAQLDDVIAGLEMGADDYLPKPFEPKELDLRIRNIINKTKKNNLKRIIEFEKVKIDLNKQIIFHGNSEFKINNTEKTILEKMINNPGKVFEREEIGKLIDLDKERSIDVIITRLRKKIEIDPKNPKFLQTIRGAGYVLWIE